jgi:iron complex transport system ATP-binding protein
MPAVSASERTLVDFPPPCGLRASDVACARDGRAILDGVNLSISPGEFWALVGPNGSGKSSILRILAGLWTTTGGAVILDGVPIARMRRDLLARRISLVPQETKIDFRYTVEEIVATGRHPHRGRFTRESATDRRLIAEAMERCDIAHLHRRIITTLSGGERQRALIARSLATSADYLLLDEPTCNLDVEHTIEVLDLCRSLSTSGRTVVLASHDLSAVAGCAASVAVVKHGHLVASGPRDRILTPKMVEDVFNVEAEFLKSASGTPVVAFGQKSHRSRRPPCETMDSRP